MKNKFVKAISHVAIVLLAGALAAPILAELAYRERGYTAFGGEWLATILIMVVTYLFVRKKDEPKENTTAEFIEVEQSNGNRRLVNMNSVMEVYEKPDGTCLLSLGADYDVYTNKSYDEVVAVIKGDG